MNAEIIERIERSFDIEKLLDSPGLDELIKDIARIMKQTGEIAGAYETGKSAKRGRWLALPYAYDQAVSAANVFLEFHRPPGEPKMPEPTIAQLLAAAKDAQLPTEIQEALKKWGQLMAAREIQKKEQDDA